MFDTVSDIRYYCFMKAAMQQITKVYRQLRGLFPSALPTGMAEFDAWVDSLMSTYALPTKNRDDVVFACGSMIMHGGPTVSRKPKYYFVLCLRAAAAKQIAGAAFYDIKTRQEKAKLAEATASSAVVSDGKDTK